MTRARSALSVSPTRYPKQYFQPSTNPANNLNREYPNTEAIFFILVLPSAKSQAFILFPQPGAKTLSNITLPNRCFYLNSGPLLLNGFRDSRTSSRKPASFPSEKQAVPPILYPRALPTLFHTLKNQSPIITRAESKHVNYFLLNTPQAPKATSTAFRISPVLSRDDSGAHAVSEGVLTLASWWPSKCTGYLGSSSGRVHLGHCGPSRQLGHFVMKSFSVLGFVILPWPIF